MNVNVCTAAIHDAYPIVHADDGCPICAKIEALMSSIANRDDRINRYASTIRALRGILTTLDFDGDHEPAATPPAQVQIHVAVQPPTPRGRDLLPESSDPRNPGEVKAACAALEARFSDAEICAIRGGDRAFPDVGQDVRSWRGRPAAARAYEAALTAALPPETAAEPVAPQAGDGETKPPAEPEPPKFDDEAADQPDVEAAPTDDRERESLIRRARLLESRIISAPSVRSELSLTDDATPEATDTATLRAWVHLLEEADRKAQAEADNEVPF